MATTMTTAIIPTNIIDTCDPIGVSFDGAAGRGGGGVLSSAVSVWTPSSLIADTAKDASVSASASNLSMLIRGGDRCIVYIL